MQRRVAVLTRQVREQQYAEHAIRVLYWVRTQRENIVLYDSMGARCGGEQREKQHRVRNEQRENARIAIYDPGS